MRPISVGMVRRMTVRLFFSMNIILTGMFLYLVTPWAKEEDALIVFLFISNVLGLLFLGILQEVDGRRNRSEE